MCKLEAAVYSHRDFQIRRSKDTGKCDAVAVVTIISGFIQRPKLENTAGHPNFRTPGSFFALIVITG